MFPSYLIARTLLLKGMAIGCVGSVYWSLGQAETAAGCLTFAICYVAAAWFVERRMP